MLGQVTRLMDPVQRGALTARLHAWWDGRDYVPSDPASAPGEVGGAVSAAAPESRSAEPPNVKKPGPTPAKATAPDTPVPKTRRNRNPDHRTEPGARGLTPRIRALEALWGEGRFGPGSGALDSLLLDEALGGADPTGGLGMIGADAALVLACNNRSNRPLHLSDWREGCAERTRGLAADVEVEIGEPDRPRGLPQGVLGALVSVDAFAYADHKAGLIARAYKALSDTGRWVILDTSRTTPKAPAEAFASAWAEPQVGEAREIEEGLRLAGFHKVRRMAVTDLVLDATRQGYSRLASELGPAAASGQDSREDATFLHELAWEAASWRARLRALEGGALAVDLWIAEKTGEPAASSPTAVTAAPVKPTPTRSARVDPVSEPPAQLGSGAEDNGPLDQSSVDSLFD